MKVIKSTEQKTVTLDKIKQLIESVDSLASPRNGMFILVILHEYKNIEFITLFPKHDSKTLQIPKQYFSYSLGFDASMTHVAIGENITDLFEYLDTVIDKLYFFETVEDFEKWYLNILKKKYE